MKLLNCGALTSKPYAFTSRPWELRSLESIDFLDSFASKIRVDIRGLQVMRILPRVLSEGEWISDKIRFSYDSFRRQRLMRPLLKKQDGFLASSWQDAFLKIFEFVEERHQKVLLNIVAGPYTSVEAGVAAKVWANRWFDTHNFYLDVNNVTPVAHKGLFNDLYVGKQVYFLVSFNPRFEAPLLNLELRRAVVTRDAMVITLGNTYNLTYNTLNLGINKFNLTSLFTGSSKIIKYFLKKTGHIFMGHSLLNQPSLISLLELLVTKLNRLSSEKSWSLSLVPLWLSTAGLVEIGWGNPLADSFIKAPSRLIVNFNDELSFSPSVDDLIVYMGSIGDKAVEEADVILPSPLPIEEDSSYVNYKGISTETRLAIAPALEVRSEWAFFSAFNLYAVKRGALNINAFFNGRNLGKLDLSSIRQVCSFFLKGSRMYLDQPLMPVIVRYKGVRFNSSVTNYYATHALTRNSGILALAYNRYKRNENFRI